MKLGEMRQRGFNQLCIFALSDTEETLFERAPELMRDSRFQEMAILTEKIKENSDREVRKVQLRALAVEKGLLYEIDQDG